MVVTVVQPMVVTVVVHGNGGSASGGTGGQGGSTSICNRLDKHR